MPFWWAGTGFNVTKLFHLSVMTDDLYELHDFYERVFGVTRHQTAPWFPHRFGSFTMIADTWIENVCPDQRWETPLRAQSHTIGNHWQSPGLYVEDMQEAVYNLAHRHDVRLTAMGTGAPVLHAPHPLQARDDWPDDHRYSATEAFTHPWDTGVMWILVEFDPATSLLDPRAGDPEWTYELDPADPLGIVRTSHHTLVVDDIEPSRRFLVDMCGGRVVRTTTSDLLGVESTWVEVGTVAPVLVEIARPVADGAAHRDLLRHNSIHHSSTFEVADLDAAVSHLSSAGIGLETRSENLVVTDPATCMGLRFGFASGVTA